MFGRIGDLVKCPTILKLLELKSSISLRAMSDPMRHERGKRISVARREGNEGRGSRYLTKQSIEVFCGDPIQKVEMEKKKERRGNKVEVKILHVPRSMLRVPRSQKR